MESNTLSIHPDSANFHFDNYQRFIHINGCTYRYSKASTVLRSVGLLCISFLTLRPFLSPFLLLSLLPYFTFLPPFSSYNIDVVNGQPRRLVKQYSVDFKQQYQRERIADMVNKYVCDCVQVFRIHSVSVV